MPNYIKLISKKCFPKTIQVTDKLHIQRLALEALQENRIKHRWEAMNIENRLIMQAKRENRTYIPELLPNGDSAKQLLAKSRYKLYNISTKMD